MKEVREGVGPKTVWAVPRFDFGRGSLVTQKAGSLVPGSSEEKALFWGLLIGGGCPTSWEASYLPTLVSLFFPNYLQY